MTIQRPSGDRAGGGDHHLGASARARSRPCSPSHGHRDARQALPAPHRSRSHHPGRAVSASPRPHDPPGRRCGGRRAPRAAPAGPTSARSGRPARRRRSDPRSSRPGPPRASSEPPRAGAGPRGGGSRAGSLRCPSPSRDHGPLAVRNGRGCRTRSGPRHVPERQDVEGRHHPHRSRGRLEQRIGQPLGPRRGARTRRSPPPRHAPPVPGPGRARSPGGRFVRRLDDGGELGIRWGRPRLRVERATLTAAAPESASSPTAAAASSGPASSRPVPAGAHLSASGTRPERSASARRHGSRVR